MIYHLGWLCALIMFGVQILPLLFDFNQLKMVPNSFDSGPLADHLLLFSYHLAILNDVIISFILLAFHYTLANSLIHTDQPFDFCWDYMHLGSFGSPDFHFLLTFHRITLSKWNPSGCWSASCHICWDLVLAAPILLQYSTTARFNRAY